MCDLIYTFYIFLDYNNTVAYIPHFINKKELNDLILIQTTKSFINVMMKDNFKERSSQ